MTLKSKNRLCGRLLLAVAGWAFGCSPQALAATLNVDIINFAFSPNSVTINVNDTVHWTWSGNYHSTTSDGGLWDSGIYNAPHTYGHTFNSAGSFPYSCSFHYFTGAVTVQGPNSPPTVAITNPPNGAILSAPATLTLKATASDSDGSVTNVQFFQGATSLGNVANNPYSEGVSGLAAGDYGFSTVATDNGGLRATNAITIHVVTPVAITLGGLQRSSATGFRFNYAANVGLNYVVQRSGDLIHWIGISTNTAGSNPVLFQDNNATGSPGFYRVARLPNP